MLSRYRLAAAGLAVAVLCAMTGCGGGEELTVPTEYILGEEHIPALPAEEGVRLSEQAPGETGEVFTYEPLPGGAALVEDYAAALTGEENGFTPVDASFRETQAPDYAAAEGEIRLARDAQQAGKVLLLTVGWSGEACVVTTSMPDGAVAYHAPEGMTLPEALQFLRGLDPADIGLGGASMEEYEVYTMDGAVLVDGHPCIQLNVYSKLNPAKTNAATAFYLLTSDAEHIYRLDQENQTVAEIPLPSFAGRRRMEPGSPAR